MCVLCVHFRLLFFLFQPESNYKFFFVEKHYQLKTRLVYRIHLEINNIRKRNKQQTCIRKEEINVKNLCLKYIHIYIAEMTGFPCALLFTEIRKSCTSFFTIHPQIGKFLSGITSWQKHSLHQGLVVHCRNFSVNLHQRVKWSLAMLCFIYHVFKQIDSNDVVATCRCYRSNQSAMLLYCSDLSLVSCIFQVLAKDIRNRRYEMSKYEFR